MIYKFIIIAIATLLHLAKAATNEFIVQLKPSETSFVDFFSKYYTNNNIESATLLYSELLLKESQNFLNGYHIKPKSNELQILTFKNFYSKISNSTTAKEENLLPSIQLVYGQFPNKVLSQMYDDPNIEAISLNRQFVLSTEDQASVQYINYNSENTTSDQGNNHISIEGLKEQSNEYYQGIGVDVYIYDTGIKRSETHFGTRLHKILDYSLSEESDAKYHEHGTNVAAIIGSSRIGIASKCNLYDMKLSNKKTTDLFTLIMALKQGYLHAKMTNRPSLFMISWIAKKSHILENVLQEIQENNASKLTVVVPGGNSPKTSACALSPSGTLGVISVGSLVDKDSIYRNKENSIITTNLKVADFSTNGMCLDYFASGYLVDTLCFAKNANEQDDLYQCKKSGTSISAAIVAGYEALKLSVI
jgi:subtilase-type proteinase RRT12